MAISDSYLEYLKDLLAWVPQLRIKKMFGGAGAHTGGSGATAPLGPHGYGHCTTRKEVVFRRADRLLRAVRRLSQLPSFDRMSNLLETGEGFEPEPGRTPDDSLAMASG
jgi:hypothetical protein